MTRHFSKFLTQDLTCTGAHRRPTSNQVRRRVNIPGTLSQLPHSRVAIYRSQVTFTDLGRPIVIARRTSFAIAHQLGPSVLHNGILLGANRHHHRSTQYIHTRCRLAILRTNTTLNNRRMRMVTRPMRVQPFDPCHVRTVTTPGRNFVILRHPHT